MLLALEVLAPTVKDHYTLKCVAKFKLLSYLEMVLALIY